MKKVLFDTIFLSMLFHQKNSFPQDPATKKEVTNPKERIEYLIETLEQDDAKIIVPTPALGELLAVTGTAGPLYLSEISNNTVFKIESYDVIAAVENGALEASGAKRIGDAPRQKTKVDRQIVSIAKVHGVSVIYSDDKDIKTLGDSLGIKVVRVYELDLRPEEPLPPLLEHLKNELAKDLASAASVPSSSETEPPSSQSHADAKQTSTPPAPAPPSAPQAAPAPPPQGSSQSQAKPQTEK